MSQIDGPLFRAILNRPDIHFQGRAFPKMSEERTKLIHTWKIIVPHSGAVIVPKHQPCLRRCTFGARIKAIFLSQRSTSKVYVRGTTLIPFITSDKQKIPLLRAYDFMISQPSFSLILCRIQRHTFVCNIQFYFIVTSEFISPFRCLNGAFTL